MGSRSVRFSGLCGIPLAGLLVLLSAGAASAETQTHTSTFRGGGTVTTCTTKQQIWEGFPVSSSDTRCRTESESEHARREMEFQEWYARGVASRKECEAQAVAQFGWKYPPPVGTLTPQGIAAYETCRKTQAEKEAKEVTPPRFR